MTKYEFTKTLTDEFDIEEDKAIKVLKEVDKRIKEHLAVEVPDE